MIKIGNFIRYTGSLALARSGLMGGGNGVCMGKFCSDKKQDDKKKEGNGQGKGPQVIEISKSQFAAMKKFLEDIKMSMPMPDITPFTPNPKGSTQQYEDVRPPTDEDSEHTQLHFSKQQQILSFKLLKLMEPAQFGPIFEQNKNSQKLGSRLIILHRYLSVGGTLNKHGVSTAEKYGYECMVYLLARMRQMEEKELQALLALYLGLYRHHSQHKEELTGKAVELPKLDTHNIGENELPLVSNPTHSSTRVLVLLIKFWDIQADNKRPLSNRTILSLQKILNHYKLQSPVQEQGPSLKKQSAETEEYTEYPADQLVYVGIWAYACNLEDYNAIPMLTSALKTKSKAIGKRKVIKTTKAVLQNVDVIASPTPTILGHLDALSRQLVEAIHNIMRLPTTQQQQKDDKTVLQQQQPEMLSFQLAECSGEISSLLHLALLAIHDKPTSALTLKLAKPLVETILADLPIYLSQVAALPLPEYSEFWQSAMLLYKLQRAHSKALSDPEKLMYALVDAFMARLNGDDVVKITVNESSGAVVEEFVEDAERRLFDALVGYRTIVPVESMGQHKNHTNLGKEVEGGEQEGRKILQSLLTAYQRTIENMHKSCLITRTSPAVHNVIITCMISEAYPQPTGKNSNKTMIEYLRSESVMEILREFGQLHGRYGKWVTKLLDKYQGN